MIFKPGDRVITRTRRRLATVIAAPVNFNELPRLLAKPEALLVCIRLDPLPGDERVGDTRRCFMQSDWLEHLNPVEWIAEIKP